MATTYPVALDAWASESGTTALSSSGTAGVSHAGIHTDVANAIEALEKYVGTSATQTAPAGAVSVLRATSASASAWSTATYPDTAAVSTILYASATNVISALATANSGILVTSGTGVPSIATDIPTAVTIGTAYIYRVGGTDVAVADGGTGLSTIAVSQILYASATDTIAGLATANNGVLVTGGTGVPSIATDIPTAVTIGGQYVYRVTGTDVTLADGGTSASLTAANGGIVYSTATAMAILAAGSSGQLLQSAGAATPAWTTATYPAIATGAGKILRADGTNWLATTLTIPDTAAVSTILYASATNVISALATANSGVLVTSGTGIPAIATDIPTAVTIGAKYIYRADGTDVPFGDGGTGISSWTQYLIPYAATTTSIGQIAIGTSGHVLTSNGAGAAPTFQAAASGGSTLISKFFTDVTVANTVTETTIMTFTIGAAVLGTNNLIKIEIPSECRNDTAADQITFRLKYGATTVATAIMPAVLVSTKAYSPLYAYLANDASASAQKGSIMWVSWDAASGGIQRIYGEGTATENSAGALTCSITVQWDNNAVNSTYTAKMGFATLFTA